eukprot:IDg13450t1
MKKLVRRLPLHCLLLESDSPALAAVAGARNEPANVVTAAQLIASEKGLQEGEVREALLANSHRCFSRLVK